MNREVLFEALLRVAVLELLSLGGRLIGRHPLDRAPEHVGRPRFLSGPAKGLERFAPSYDVKVLFNAKGTHTNPWLRCGVGGAHQPTHDSQTSTRS